MVIANLSEKDFREIQKIALSIDGFSVPSDYILWMLAKTQRNFCKVARHNGKLIAYMLVIKSMAANEAFLWQLGGLKLKTTYLALQMVCKKSLANCEKKGIKYVRFTSSEGKRKKLFEILIKSVLGKRAKLTGNKVYISNSKYEFEYKVSLK